MARGVRATLVGVMAATLVVTGAAPAAAHNYVVASTPADGEVLTALPESWLIETNDSLLYGGNDEVFGMWARDADGLYYGDGCVDVSGPQMTADPAIGAPGEYTLVFQFVSADGHPLSGEIPFEWAPEGEHQPATGSAELPRCGVAVDGEPDLDGPVRAEPEWPGVPGDVWWIVGAVGAVVLASVAAVVFTRRRPRGSD